MYSFRTSFSTIGGLSRRLRVAGEMGKVMGDFLIFVFLMLVKFSYAHSEYPGHLSEYMVKCASCWLIWDNPAIRVNLIPFILTYFQPCFHLFLWIGRDDHEKGIGNIVRPCTISVTQDQG